MQPGNTLSLTLATGNYSVDGAAERNGQTLVRLTAEEVSPNGRSMEIEGYEGAVLVTPDAVIYQINASFDRRVEGTTDHYEQSMTLETDPGWMWPPSWVAKLPHLSLSVVEDGQALELRNTGGAALPAGMSFNLCVGNATEYSKVCVGDTTATVSTDRRLEPGDAIYITGDTEGDASTFALHDERERGEYTYQSASVYGESENHIYQLATDCAEYRQCRDMYNLNVSG